MGWKVHYSETGDREYHFSDWNEAVHGPHIKRADTHNIQMSGNAPWLKCPNCRMNIMVGNQAWKDYEYKSPRTKYIHNHQSCGVTLWYIPQT